MSKLLITVPQPCHEGWDTMLPAEKGRHCNACNKTVVDFTRYSDAELLAFFTERKGEKVCGHFKSSQLQPLKIEIPEVALHQQMSYLQRFLLALFIVFSTTLFSCRDDAGTPVSVDVKVDSIEYYGKDCEKPDSNADKSIANTHTAIDTPIKRKLKYVETVVDGDVIVVEYRKAPVFKGYYDSLAAYVKDELAEIDIPEPLPDKMTVLLTINEHGKPQNVHLKNPSGNEEFDKQLVSIIENMPDWQPAIDANGLAITMECSIPLVFKR